MTQISNVSPSPVSDGPLFFGRREDLATVVRLLGQAPSERPPALLVSGESGIGKSAFLRRCGEVAAANATVLATTCRPGAGPTADALAQLVAELPSQRSSAYADASVVADTARAFELLHRHLTTMSKRRPILVTVDNLDVATVRDIQLVHYLVDTAAPLPLLTLGAVREDGATRSPIAMVVHAWISSGACRHPIGPLEDTDIQLLVWNLAARDSLAIDPAAMREIVVTAEGNPRFAHELVACVRGGVRRPEALVPAASVAFASSLKATLPKSSYDVLTVACAIGRRFCGAWLLELTAEDERIVTDALQAACDAGILSECGDDPGHFEFRHVAVMKAMYAALISSRRLLLHARIADLLVRLNVEAPYDRLVAEQLAACGRSDEAREWLGRVGTRLVSAGDFGGAADFYARAASLSPYGSDEWVQMQVHSARWYGRIGSSARSTLLREELVQCLLAKGPSDALSHALFTLFFDYIYMEQWQDAERILEQMRALAHPTANDYEARVETAWAIFLSAAGREEEARRTLARVEASPPTYAPGVVEFFLSKAAVNRRVQPVEETDALLDRAVAEADAESLAAASLVSHTLGAEIMASLGHIDAAKRRAEEGTRFVPLVPERVDNAVDLTVVRAQLCVLAGELETARELVRSVFLVQFLGKHYATLATGVAVFVAMRTGDSSVIQALFDIGLLDGAAASRDAEACGSLIRGFAEVMHVRGLSDRLSATLRAFVAAKLDDPYLWIQLAAAQYGDAETVDAARSQIERRKGGTDAPVVDAARAMFDAYVLAREGKRMRSLQAAREAAEAYRALRWPVFEARALEAAGDVAGAVALYTQCGAAADVSRLRAQRTSRVRRARFAAPLTFREREVAVLVARGRSDREIAQALNVSERTVHHHVAAILSKLGLRSRWQITAELAQ